MCVFLVRIFKFLEALSDGKISYAQQRGDFIMDKKKNKIGNIENQEDVTKYGEFVSSYFAWMTLEKQKENTEKLEDMTKND